MTISGRTAACVSVIISSLLILVAVQKHFSDHIPDALVAVDKYGIPIDEKAHTSTSEMEKTDLMMLQTVKELEAKVASLSQQMNALSHDASHSAVIPKSDDTLSSKVDALSNSLLDTIQAVQHLSNQVSQLEMRRKKHDSDASTTSAESRSKDRPDTTYVRSPLFTAATAQSIAKQMKSKKHIVDDNSSLDLESTSHEGDVISSQQDSMSTLIPRLQEDVRMLKASFKNRAISGQQREALSEMAAEISNILREKERAVVKTPGAPPVSKEHGSQENTVSTAAGVDTAVSKIEDSSPQSAVARLISPNELQTQDLKARTHMMQIQVAALAEKERKMLNALPSIQDEINRDRATLSDGLQSLEIAQDRLILASKAAEDSADASVIATKALAQQREAQVQIKVKEELHRLAEAKRLAAEGPELAKQLHERRTSLRRLESQLERATLLHKARLMESSKDFAG